MVHDPFTLFRRIKRTIWAVYDTSIYLRGIEKVQNHDPRGKIDKNIEASRNIQLPYLRILSSTQR